MMFPNTCCFVIFLSLLRESTAINPIQGPITGDVSQYEKTVPGNPELTVLRADVVAPSGSVAVIDFELSRPARYPATSATIATMTSSCLSSPCPVTLTPYKFRPTVVTWIQHLDTTFSVPTGSTPVIHFSPAQYGRGQSSMSSIRSIASSQSSTATDGFGPVINHGTTPRASAYPTPNASPSTRKWVTDAASSPINPDPAHSRTLSPSVSQSESSIAQLTNGPTTVNNPQSGRVYQSTSGPDPSNTSQPSTGSPSANRPYFRTTSATILSPPKSTQGQQSNVLIPGSSHLDSAPGTEEMSSMLATLTGTSSAEVALMLSQRPTVTAAVAWDVLESELSQILTGTTSGTAATTEGITLAGWLTKLNGNIQVADLKDRNTWTRVKNNIDEAGDRIENYIKNRKSHDDSGTNLPDSDDSGCKPGEGLFSIFKVVSCFIKKAEDNIKDGSKDIGPIIDEGFGLTKSALIQLKDNLPDPDAITAAEEDQFKINFEDLTEGAETLEKLEEEKEKQTASSTIATTSPRATSSETSTCTSSTTVEDCKMSTLFITSTITGSDGSMSPTVITSTTSTCLTQTGCQVTGTTQATTAYTRITGACSRRTPKFTAAPIALATGGSTVTSRITSASVTSGPSTLLRTFITTHASSSAELPCKAQSFQVASGWESLCVCSTTSTSGALTSTITTPSGGGCDDYTTFPSTGFINVPAATANGELCGYHFGGRDGKDGYCACQTSINGVYSSEWVPLPYVQGSETVFECHAITSVSFSPTSTPTASATQSLITDYTSTDIGNGAIYAFATAYITTDSNNYGGLPDFTPVVETIGMGTATFEEVHGYHTANGLTTYYYAEATGNGNGDLTPNGTPTATAGPKATQNCVRYVIPGPDTNHVYNSAKDETIYAFWGISGWNTTHLDEKIPDLLRSCKVKEQIDVQVDTGRWATVVMWNNGREYDLTPCVNDGLLFLGATPLSHGNNCKLIPHDNGSTGFWYEDSAPAEIDWIYDNYPHMITAPYPLGN